MTSTGVKCLPQKGMPSRAELGGSVGTEPAPLVPTGVLAMTVVRAFLFLAVVTLVAGLPSALAGVMIVDDFQGQTLGAFPSGWLDVGAVNPGSTAPNPSAVVVSTTDAFGSSTQALSILDAFAASQGIYQTIPNSPFVEISVDVRVDRFSTPSAVNVSDWPIDITLSQLRGTMDLSGVPSMGVYAASASGTWNSYIATDNLSYIPDFGVPVGLGTWYRVELGLNTMDGIMSTLVTDIALSTVVLDRVDMVPGWKAADGVFDAVGFFDGELSSNEVSNLVVIDNIRVPTAPEPSVLWLFAVGALLVRRTSRRSKG